MKYGLFYLCSIWALLLCTAAGLSCEEDAGAIKFFDGEEQITPETFNCMKVTKDSKSTLQVLAPEEMRAPLTCSALQDGKASVKVKYERVEVSTGIMCTLQCKIEPGRFRCRKKPAAGECLCEPMKPEVIVKPVSSEIGPGPLIGGQSDILSGVRAQTCIDKPVGFRFPDAVPCVSFRGDVKKRRVQFIKGKEGECSVKTSTEPETRYTSASPDNRNLQGCVYVCKMAGPRCTERQAGSKCSCASPGMTKQLVGLDDLEVEARIRQTTCGEDGSCGVCGRCEEGICKLKPKAHLGNYCPCGKICPETDRRTENLGGQLGCVSNLAMDCMGQSERQVVGDGLNYKPGRQYPDLCTEGKTDAADTCGCEKGYEMKPGSEGQSVICALVSSFR